VPRPDLAMLGMHTHLVQPGILRSLLRPRLPAPGRWGTILVNPVTIRIMRFFRLIFKFGSVAGHMIVLAEQGASDPQRDRTLLGTARGKPETYEESRVSKTASMPCDSVRAPWGIRPVRTGATICVRIRQQVRAYDKLVVAESRKPKCVATRSCDAA